MPQFRRRPFNPAKFTGTAVCRPEDDNFEEGRLLQCGSTFMDIALHVKGDGGAYFSLALGQGRKEIIAFMGAAEWPDFLERVEIAKAYYERLKAGGKCDEITPCPPG